MLLWLALILIAAWFLGLLVFHAGAFIHLALLVAAVIIVWHLVTRGRLMRR
jgi:hypothetical protein